MTRTTVQVVSLASAAAISLVLAQSAAAQREGGRRVGRGFPLSSIRLATATEVQEELKLSDEQKNKIAEINGKLREDIRQAFQSGGGFQQLQTLNEQAFDKLAEVLDAGQQKRLMGIAVQVNGPGALVEPAVMSELKITDDQKSKLADIRQSGLESFRSTFQQMRDQDLSLDQMRAKFDELRNDTNEKLLAVLTSDQQAQLSALEGEPVDIEFSQFRGPGAGGAQDNGRERDESGEKESSESESTAPEGAN